jgi:hypothetical protein
MGIHLAAEGFKVEGFLGCHGNLKYTVKTDWGDWKAQVCGEFLLRTDVKVSPEEGPVFWMYGTSLSIPDYGAPRSWRAVGRRSFDAGNADWENYAGVLSGGVASPRNE